MTRKLRTTAERKLTPAERDSLLTLLDEEDLIRLDALLPLIGNEPAWWLQREIHTKAEQIRLKRAAEARRGP
jgi:hypothetical protein